MMTYQREDECKLCQKLQTKWGRVQKEQERIKRWKTESGRRASIAAAEDLIEKLEQEINDLNVRKYEQAMSLSW